MQLNTNYLSTMEPQAINLKLNSYKSTQMAAPNAVTKHDTFTSNQPYFGNGVSTFDLVLRKGLRKGMKLFGY